MGAARTSDARETDYMCEAIGVDSHNLCTTGKITKTMTAGRNDKSNIPCVLIQGGVLFPGREDGADICPSGMCEHTCTERLQTTTSGDI